MLPIALFALCAFSLASAKLTPIVVRHRSLPSRDFLLAPRGLVRPTTGRIPKLRDPAELASGSLNVAGGCRNWWLVERGETCSSVAERNAISFEQFRAWNPAIDERCFNLYAGQAYCVLAPKTVSLPPVSTAVVAPQPTPSAGSNTSPQVYTGDATYFKAGLGACGTTVNGDRDYVVAMSHLLFDTFPGATSNPNLNPICGRRLRVSYGSKSVVVRVQDRCPDVTCKYGDVDLSAVAFAELAPYSVGRMPISWIWIS